MAAWGQLSRHPACHVDGHWQRSARVLLVGVVVAYAGEQLLMFWASGEAQLLGGRVHGGVVALGLGGRGRRSGRHEFVADGFLGRLIGVTGEVGEGAPGVAGTVAGALVSGMGV